MRWPPVKPSKNYDATNPPPKFLPPAFDYNAMLLALVKGTELPVLTENGMGDGSTVRTNAPRPYVQTPVVFTGQDAHYTYRDYIQSCRNYCMVVYTENYSKTQLFNTARSYLGKEAMTFSLHDAKRNAHHNWESWDKMMKQRWLDPNLRANAMAALARKRHNVEESIHDYTLSFHTLCNDAELSLDNMLPSTVAMFLNSLQTDLRTGMLYKNSQDEIEKMSWPQLCELAHAQAHALGKYGPRKRQKTSANNDRSDGRYDAFDNPRGRQPRGSRQQREQQSQAHGNNGGRRRNGRNGRGKGKGGKGRRNGSKGSKNSNNSGGDTSANYSRLRPARSREEREQYMQEQRCFDCGQTGHMRGAPECPARTQNNYTEEQISALADRLTATVFDRLEPAAPGNAAGTSNTDGQLLATSSQPQQSANRSLVLSPSRLGPRRS